MRCVVLITMLLTWSLIASANDMAISGVGGSWQPLEGEHESIRMVREHVRMTVLPEYSYRVAVDFVFHNDGPATSVLMGFPESNGGEVEPDYWKNRSSYTGFATYVDGVQVKARRRFLTANNYFEAYWVKRVYFARGQARRVCVRYMAPCGGDSKGGIHSEYNFTGGNWSGKVDESLLNVSFEVPGSHRMETRFEFGAPTGRGSMLQNQRANRFFYRWRDWQAEGYFSLRYITVQQNQLAVNDETLPDEVEPLFTLPFKRPPTILSVVRHAPAALHNGMAVMAMRDLEQWLSLQLERRNPQWMSNDPSTEDPNVAPRRLCQVTWNEDRRTAYLRAGPHLFVLWPGKAQMLINGRVHHLPEPPLLVRGRHGYYLYIPLKPVMKTLGGKVKLVPEQRRIWFHL